MEELLKQNVGATTEEGMAKFKEGGSGLCTRTRDSRGARTHEAIRIRGY